MGAETKKKRSSREGKGEGGERGVEPACLVSELWFSFQFVDVITVTIVLVDVI